MNIEIQGAFLDNGDNNRTILIRGLKRCANVNSEEEAKAIFDFFYKSLPSTTFDQLVELFHEYKQKWPNQYNTAETPSENSKS